MSSSTNYLFCIIWSTVLKPWKCHISKLNISEKLCIIYQNSSVMLKNYGKNCDRLKIFRSKRFSVMNLTKDQLGTTFPKIDFCNWTKGGKLILSKIYSQNFWVDVWVRPDFAIVHCAKHSPYICARNFSPPQYSFF